MLAVAFFSKSQGVFFGGDPKIIGIQLLGVVMIIVWTAFWSGLYFGIAKKLGKLRIDPVDEILGLDLIEHASYEGLEIETLKINLENILYVKDQTPTQVDEVAGESASIEAVGEGAAVDAKDD